MAIDKWQRPDYDAVLQERREREEATAARRKLEAEALEYRRQQKAAKEREELWSWYENDYDVADSFKAQQDAREMKRTYELKQEIGAELLAVEMDQAASETSDALDPSGRQLNTD